MALHPFRAVAAYFAGACIACILLGVSWSAAWFQRPFPRVRRRALQGNDSSGLSTVKLEALAEELERRYVRSGKIKGGVLAVVKAGRVVALWELGAYTSETVFKLYSISKVFTAIAGLQLCEERGISLDTPVSLLVPEWPADLRDQSGSLLPPLLLKHCLSQTGGFSKALPTVHPIASLSPVELRRLRERRATPRNLKEMVELEGQYPHLFAPGSHFNYCGVGSQLVARFVEEASGMTISKYMEERIFRPAAMCSTGFVIDESLAKNCVSTDYHPWVLSSVADGVPSKWSRLRLRLTGLLSQLCGRQLLDHLKPAGSGVILPTKLWDRSLELFHPDAGTVGTAADFVKWMQIMTAGGERIDASGRQQVLSKFVLDSLATPVTPELQPPFAWGAPTTANQLFPVRNSVPRPLRETRPFNSFPGQKFSLGGCVIVEPHKAGLPKQAEGTWHWMGFASTYFFVNPREELSACFLTQLVSHRTYPILDELVKGVHDALK